VRLTLRTLLAYLDDTLEPAQAKVIGQKIAESPTAQELVARIREVVRKRRITTPPATGPGAKLDPNTVAEYIDSVLSPEQLAEVEDVCLNSDVHLAEIAACHQILTLILSEPVLVPPTARQRMYGLAKGREAIPYRKPAAGSEADGAEERASTEGNEADEALLLGLPSYSGQGAWLRRLAPLVGVVLLVLLLGVAIWQALPALAPGRAPREAPAVAAVAVAEKPAEPVAEQPKLPEKPDARAGTAKPAEATPVPSKPSAEIPPPSSTSVPKAKPETISEAMLPVPPPQPSRKAVGRYVAENIPTILVRRNKGTEPWERLVRETPVYTTDRLVSLPGYRSEVRLDNDVHLVLWGDVPDSSTRVLMLQSAVVLNNSPNVDVDLVLDTGRISISNHKREGPARVRVRFHDQVWDLTLENRAEVAMELLSLPDFGFSTDPAKTSGPIAGLGLFMLQGQGNLKIRYETYLLREPPGPAQVIWNNVGGMRGPQTIRSEQLPPWARRLPSRGKEAQAMGAAQDGLANRMSGRGPVDLVLEETLKEQEAASRILAVYCIGATDDLPHLLNALADEKYADVRIAAIGALRHWIGRRAENDQQLYQALQQKYKSSLAEIIMELLHPFSEKQKHEPETYETLIAYLNHDKLPVRELAYSHLVALVPQGAKIPYDPAGGVDKRDFSYQEWKKLIPQGKLPPSATQPTPMGGGVRGSGSRTQ
jgi:hypothetical protein